MDESNVELLNRIRITAQQKILFLQHALDQMNAPKRMIETREVRSVIMNGIIIENYPDDVRGHSCLMLGWGKGDRPIHIVCAPKDVYLAIITAYLPSEDRWESDWITRKRK